MGLQSSLVKKKKHQQQNYSKLSMAFKMLAITKLSMQEERIQKALYAAMLSNMLMTEKRLTTQQNLGETPVSVRAYE